MVQSTRAGAENSLGLIPVIIGCLLLKYPAFLQGPLYTKVTGESVVKGYARLGSWTLPTIAFSFLGIMFTVVAAVALLAASLFNAAFSLNLNVTALAIGLTLVSTYLSIYTSFSQFQGFMKLIFILMVFASLLVLGLALPKIDPSNLVFDFNPLYITREQIYFIAALIGWMPAGMDLPMMHSQWLLARPKAMKVEDNAIEDFNFGYLSTSFLALLFVMIGAVFMYGTGVHIEESAGGFSKQLLGIYQSSLGSFAGLTMGLTLFLTIFSTLYVVIDGFPRVLAEVAVLSLPQRGIAQENLRIYSAWVQAGGGALLLIYFAGALHALVDFATVLSFLLGQSLRT